MTSFVLQALMVPPSPQGWVDGLARQRSLGGTKRKVFRIKELT